MDNKELAFKTLTKFLDFVIKAEEIKLSFRFSDGWEQMVGNTVCQLSDLLVALISRDEVRRDTAFNLTVKERSDVDKEEASEEESV